MQQCWPLTRNFYNSKTINLCFPWKKTGYKRSLFCYTRIHSCVRISNDFESASRMLTNYCRWYFPIAEIISKCPWFAKTKCLWKANFSELPKTNKGKNSLVSRCLVYELFWDIGFKFGFTNLPCEKMIYITF